MKIKKKTLKIKKKTLKIKKRNKKAIRIRNLIRAVTTNMERRLARGGLAT